MKNWKLPLAALLTAAITAALSACGGGDSASSQPATGAAGAGIKIGFIVKAPDEPWFQREWRFADETGAKDGFTVIHAQGQDGEKVNSAIQNLSVQGVKGFVICTPDVKLGQAIAAQAQQNGMKVIAVDDQFVGADGKPMTDIPYVGIDAKKIGGIVGDTLMAQAKAHNWPMNETGLAAITFEELPTAKDRTDGAIASAEAAGLPAGQVFKAPMTKSNLEQAKIAATNLHTQHPEIKHWLICGMNDPVVIGGVRAFEEAGFKPADIIGVGINGDQVAIDELNRPEATGFYGTVLLSARKHGSDTVQMMYDWITSGKAPPMDTRTTGTVITRDNFHQVLKDQGVPEKS